MAGTYFLQLEGIEGEATDKGHEKWLELMTFSHGASQNVSIGRGGDVAGQGEFEPFTFTHAVDKATPKLQLYCMNGTKIGKAVLQYCRVIGGVQTPVYEVSMENVRVAKADVGTVNPGVSGLLSDGGPMDGLISARTGGGTSNKANNRDGMIDASIGGPISKNSASMKMLDQQPVETVELVAGKITWKETPIKPDGSKDGAIEAVFDQVANE